MITFFYFVDHLPCADHAHAIYLIIILYIACVYKLILILDKALVIGLAHYAQDGLQNSMSQNTNIIILVYTKSKTVYYFS